MSSSSNLLSIWASADIPAVKTVSCSAMLNWLWVMKLCCECILLQNNSIIYPVSWNVAHCPCHTTMRNPTGFHFIHLWCFLGDLSPPVCQQNPQGPQIQVTAVSTRATHIKALCSSTLRFVLSDMVFPGVQQFHPWKWKNDPKFNWGMISVVGSLLPICHVPGGSWFCQGGSWHTWKEGVADGGRWAKHSLGYIGIFCQLCQTKGWHPSNTQCSHLDCKQPKIWWIADQHLLRVWEKNSWTNRWNICVKCCYIKELEAEFNRLQLSELVGWMPASNSEHGRSREGGYK